MSDNSINYSAEFIKEAKKVIKDAFQIVLNFQTPWGEWGPGFFRHPAYLKDIERKGYTELGKMKDIDFPMKYGMSRTLRAMELLDKVNDERKYKLRIDLALGWIEDRFKGKSWFKSFILGRPKYEAGKKQMPVVNDYRHTAQAFIAWLLFNKKRLFTFKYKESILSIINQGKESGLFPTYMGDAETDFAATMWCIELKYRLLKARIPEVYFAEKTEQISFKRDIQSALDNSIRKLIKFITEDRTHYEYRLCVLFNRLTDVFIHSKRKEFLDIAITNLENKLVDGRCEHMFKMHIYITDALLCAKKKGININKYKFKQALQHIVDQFYENLYWMDTPEFIIIVNLLLEFNECKEVIQKFNGMDYIIDENIDSTKSTEVAYLLIERLYEIAVRIDKCKEGIKEKMNSYSNHSNEDYDKIPKINEKIIKLFEYMDAKKIYLYGARWDSYPIKKMTDLPIHIQKRYNRFRMKLEELCLNPSGTLIKIAEKVEFLLDLHKKAGGQQ